MRDVVLEWCIPYVMPGGKRLLKAVLLASMAVLCVDTILYPILFLPVLAFLVVGILLLRSWKYEYEYVRKDVYHFDRKEIEYVAEGKRRLTGCRSHDFTSGWEKARVYTIKLGSDLVYLEPNDEFLEEMRLHRKLEEI